MSHLLNQFAELVSLTKLYLTRDNSKQIVTDPASYAFYQEYKIAPSQDTPKQIKSNPIKENPPAPPTKTYSTPAQSISAPIATPPPSSPSKEPIKQQTETEKPQPKKAQGAFHLEPLPTLEKTNHWNHFKPLIQQHIPSYPLNEKIPSDARAQKINSAWKMDQLVPPIVILSFNDLNAQLTLLKNMAKAITYHLAPAKVISAQAVEKQNQWKELLQNSSLKLIIASDYGFYLLPELMKYYKEVPKSAKHFLHQTPLLLLSDLSLYLKEPQLKPLLWRAICEAI